MRKVKAKFLYQTTITNAEATDKMKDVISNSIVTESRINKLNNISDLLLLVDKDDLLIPNMKYIELDNSIFSIGLTSDIDYRDIASHPSFNFKYIFIGKDIYIYYWIKKNKSKKDDKK